MLNVSFSLIQIKVSVVLSMLFNDTIYPEDGRRLDFIKSFYAMADII